MSNYQGSRRSNYGSRGSNYGSRGSNYSSRRISRSSLNPRYPYKYSLPRPRDNNRYRFPVRIPDNISRSDWGNWWRRNRYYYGNRDYYLSYGYPLWWLDYYYPLYDYEYDNFDTYYIPLNNTYDNYYIVDNYNIPIIESFTIQDVINPAVTDPALPPQPNAPMQPPPNAPAEPENDQEIVIPPPPPSYDPDADNGWMGDAYHNSTYRLILLILIILALIYFVSK